MKSNFPNKVFLTLFSSALTCGGGSVYYQDHNPKHLPYFIGMVIVTIILFCLVMRDMLHYWLQKEDMNIGDQFKDNKWGDTIIEIKGLSPDRKRVRYIYIQIQGVKMRADQSLSENSISCILSEFTKIK